MGNPLPESEFDSIVESIESRLKNENKSRLKQLHTDSQKWDSDSSDFAMPESVYALNDIIGESYDFFGPLLKNKKHTSVIIRPMNGAPIGIPPSMNAQTNPPIAVPLITLKDLLVFFILTIDIFLLFWFVGFFAVQPS